MKPFLVAWVILLFHYFEKDKNKNEKKKTNNNKKQNNRLTLNLIKNDTLSKKTVISKVDIKKQINYRENWLAFISSRKTISYGMITKS